MTLDIPFVLLILDPRHRAVATVVKAGIDRFWGVEIRDMVKIWAFRSIAVNVDAEFIPVPDWE